MSSAAIKPERGRAAACLQQRRFELSSHRV